jgi:hypothetical protein
MNYGGAGIIFEEHIDPFGKIDSGMPDTAIADLWPISTAGNAWIWSQWQKTWPEGFPTWTAGLYETSNMFRARITADLQAAGTMGQVVSIWTRPGFWQRNQDGALLPTEPT